MKCLSLSNRPTILWVLCTSAKMWTVYHSDNCIDSFVSMTLYPYRKHMYDASSLNTSSTCIWPIHMIINNLDTWAKWPWSWLIPREAVVSLLCSPAVLWSLKRNQATPISCWPSEWYASKITIKGIKIWHQPCCKNDKDYITHITRGHLQPVAIHWTILAITTSEVLYPLCNFNNYICCSQLWIVYFQQTLHENKSFSVIKLCGWTQMNP